MRVSIELKKKKKLKKGGQWNQNDKNNLKRIKTLWMVICLCCETRTFILYFALV